MSRIISAIGKKAGVVVNKEQGKFGSAHDLRRAYGTRWAKRLKPFELKTLMRHETIETTERYYVEMDAVEMSDRLWAAEDFQEGHASSGSLSVGTNERDLIIKDCAGNSTSPKAHT